MAETLEAQTVFRNPFARAEYQRDAERPESECAWCGIVGAYTWVFSPDAGRTTMVRDLFCTFNCLCTYHGMDSATWGDEQAQDDYWSRYSREGSPA